MLLLIALACASTPSGDVEPSPVGEEAAPAVEAAPTEEAAEALPADDGAAGEAPLTVIPAAPAGIGADSQGDAALEVFGDFRYSVVAPPEISGSKVTLQVRHGGGCAEHGWSLAAAGSAEGGVLVANLVHDDKGDRCKALKIYPVTLDIGQQGLDLCGVSTLALAVSVDDQGASPGSYPVPVPAAFSACEGIEPGRTRSEQ